jgi:hypothetical protein
MSGNQLDSRVGGHRGPGPALRSATVHAALLVSLACAGPASEQLSCEDLLPAESASFTRLQSLILQSPRRGGCLGGPCHSAAAQSGGIRLDSPELVYDELSTRPELFYAVLASGEMPQRGRPWSLAELQVLRSWYCIGAFPP